MTLTGILVSKTEEAKGEGGDPGGGLAQGPGMGEPVMLVPWRGVRKESRGPLGSSMVECLPLAQGAILETQDRIPHGAPGAWSLLLPLLGSLPLSVCLSGINK